jgi:hypothetical protein
LFFYATPSRKSICPSTSTDSSTIASLFFRPQKTNEFLNYFSIFAKFFTAIFLVIGFKQGNWPTMGGKKQDETLESGKSREGRKRAHFTYVKCPTIKQSRGIKTPL